MAETIVIDWSPLFNFRVCADTCSPVLLYMQFNIPKQVLAEVWPVDSDGNQIPLRVTVDAENSAGAQMPTTEATILPNSLVVEIDGLTDDIYKFDVKLYDYADGAPEDQTLATLSKIAVIDCKARCCESDLAAKMLDKKCNQSVIADATKVYLLRKYMMKLLVCDNNIAGAKDMLDTIHSICRKYNCNCC